MFLDHTNTQISRNLTCFLTVKQPFEDKKSLNEFGISKAPQILTSRKVIRNRHDGRISTMSQIVSWSLTWATFFMSLKSSPKQCDRILRQFHFVVLRFSDQSLEHEAAVITVRGGAGDEFGSASGGRRAIGYFPSCFLLPAFSRVSAIRRFPMTMVT